MTLQVFPRKSSVRADPNAKILLDHIEARQEELGLQGAFVFYNFPLFREDERLLVADLVIVSPVHGIVLISTPSGSTQAAAESLDGAFNVAADLQLYRCAEVRVNRPRPQAD